MTQITSYTPLTGKQPDAGKTNKPQNSGHLFSRTMGNALNQQTGHVGQKAHATLGEIQTGTLPSIPPMDMPASAGPKILAQTDALLAAMDSYASQMADPSVSLRDLEAVVTDLKSMADTLSTHGCDPGLKEIADQCAVLAQTEAIKFQRGDYR
ncbi:MAG: hypothetical protein CSA22_08380 [Deltaproteobacteria bacterium]|nr:MAG: hypothetical protein CSA22_08380 [Deltaproteobacteria bacterium]